MPRFHTLALLALASSPALAGPGDIAWSIERDGYSFDARPTVGADGALYWSFRGLYRLDPATGQPLWFRENQAAGLVSIGPDGTIYATGSVDQGTPGQPFWHPTAIALSPDNDLLWERIYDPAYGYPDAGPTLGPDGNLYIIAYGGYRAPGHLFSLTTNGDFRWEFPHFAAGNGVQHLTFAGGNVMKVSGYIPLPGGPSSTYAAGAIAADMQSGQLAWTETFAANNDPVVSPVTGHFYLAPDLTRQVRAYSPSHEVQWSFTVDWSPTGLNTIASGPDGNLYISHGAYRVLSLAPDGSVRWSIPNALPAPYYYPPTVSPDGSVILYTTTGPGSTPGYVTALRTTDGFKLWETTLPGASGGYTPARGYGGIQFSPDSQFAYIPTATICYCGPTGYEQRGQLFAIQVSGPATCYANCDASTTPPALNILDFSCFLNKFAAGDAYANCDGSTSSPILNVLDFSCFLNRFAAGCP